MLSGSSPFLADAGLQRELYQVPAFLLSPLEEMATEVPHSNLGRRIYCERIYCLLVLTHIVRDTDTAPSGPARRAAPQAPNATSVQRGR